MSRSELIQLARSTYGVGTNGFISASLSLDIGAGAAAFSAFWAWQFPNNPALGVFPMVLERLRLQYACTTAFTDPTTAGRSLGFCKVADFPTGGGGTSNFRSQLRKSTLFNGGANGVSISSTSPLGTVPDPSDHMFAIANLATLGHEGDVFDHTWEWTTGSSQMIALQPGDIIALVCPQAMDAAGTFCIAVEAELQAVPQSLPQP